MYSSSGLSSLHRFLVLPESCFSKAPELRDSSGLSISTFDKTKPSLANALADPKVNNGGTNARPSKVWGELEAAEDGGELSNERFRLRLLIVRDLR
jgi:hypothetical protein